MPATSHAPMGGVDTSCPPADWIPRDEAAQCLDSAAEDASEAARRLRWCAGELPAATWANVAHVQHLPAATWANGAHAHHLPAALVDRLRRLATLADLVAAETRAILQEIG